MCNSPRHNYVYDFRFGCRQFGTPLDRMNASGLFFTLIARNSSHIHARWSVPHPVNARRSSLAQIATAAFASSSTLPINMKPWIWRSKQIYVTRLPAMLSACE